MRRAGVAHRAGMMGAIGAAARRILPKSARATAARAVRELYWAVAGPLTSPAALPRRFRSPLFVCQGNICRSPFAAVLARDIAARRGSEILRICSAGLRASETQGPPREAVEAAREFGVRLDGHEARQLTGGLVSMHDAIVVMEARQVHAVRRMFPGAPGVVLLPSFDTEQGTLGRYRRYNIEDPFGNDRAAFLACYERIRRCLEGLFDAADAPRGGGR